MIIIILCGGQGTRMADYSFPKPLNMINGLPSIYYCLKNIPDHIKTLHFIASPHLLKYNFEEIVKNQFKNKKCIVKWVPYYTRGALETAWLGSQDIISENETENVIFLDNDVILNFPANFFEGLDSAFLGYSIDAKNSDSFSFLKINDGGFVTDYKEKIRISDKFCCGVYGFKNLKQFKDSALHIINAKSNTEIYMSSVFKDLLEKKTPVKAIEFGEVNHIGSLKELRLSWPNIEKKQMRVCFDLDNTLVTYPNTPGDYRTVKPISKTIDLLRKMKKEGHIIIIHTARRMATHKNNVGAVIKDIGLLTFQTLADFDIPYDELIFGKPIADIYIDDRSVNPYLNSIESMGYLYEQHEEPLNMLGTNKYNKIQLIDNKVIKSGPESILRGEMFFYEKIKKVASINSYFPQFYGGSNQDGLLRLIIENIKGIPLYFLFKNCLLTDNHIFQIFEFLDILHNLPGETPSTNELIINYIDKLEKRFKIKADYPFPDSKEIQEKCINDISNYTPIGVPYIHGDLWFSNILLDFTGSIKMIDMKGQVNNKLTTGGDKYYDYGKLYQSFLGYDAVLHGDSIDINYQEKITLVFLKEAERRSIDIKILKSITFSLVLGTMHAIEDEKIKHDVWDFIKRLFI